MRCFSLLALLLAAGAARGQAPPDTLRPPVSNLYIYGWSVDADDERLLVGARETPPAGGLGRSASDPKGTVFVYRLGAGRPTLEGRLRPDGIGNQDCFSWALDIRGDVAAVGAQCEAPRGAVYIYRYDGSAWVREAKLVPADIGGQWVPTYSFGVSVALGDGTVVVGGGAPNPGNPSYPDGDYQSGAAFVFERTGTAWTYSATLLNTDTAEQLNEAFGETVALVERPGRGEVVVVGAPQDDGPGDAYSRGAVYVFERQAGAWAERAKLLCPEADQADHCGALVAAGGGGAAVASDEAVYPLAEVAGAWSVGSALTPAGFNTLGAARWGARVVAVDALAAPAFAHHPALVYTEASGAWTADVRSIPQVSQSTSFIASANSRDLFLGRPHRSEPNYVLVQRAARTTAAAPEPPAADAFGLRVVPNPSSGGTRVRFETEQAGPAQVTVTDALGRRVFERLFASLAAGPHDVSLGLGDVAPGVYVVRVEGADGAATRRLVRR